MEERVPLLVKDCKLNHTQQQQQQQQQQQPIEVLSCLSVVITVKNGGKLLVNAILYTHVHVHVFHTSVYIWNEVIVVYMCGVCRHPAQAERLSR